MRLWILHLRWGWGPSIDYRVWLYCVNSPHDIKEFSFSSSRSTTSFDLDKRDDGYPQDVEIEDSRFNWTFVVLNQWYETALSRIYRFTVYLIFRLVYYLFAGGVIPTPGRANCSIESVHVSFFYWLSGQGLEDDGAEQFEEESELWVLWEVDDKERLVVNFFIQNSQYLESWYRKIVWHKIFIRKLFKCWLIWSLKSPYCLFD